MLHRASPRADQRATKKVNTMAQQSRPHIILASLTLAGGSRYPSALGHLLRTAAVAAYLANVLELDDVEQRHIYLVAPCTTSASWAFRMTCCSSPHP